MPNSSPISATPGMKTFIENVHPRMVHSHAGMIRSAPSSQPMYQSGWDPAVTWEGSYGPKFHTGLIWNSALIRAVTPKTMKKKPPALAV